MGNQGSLLLVPLYHKFGRRPIMLFSLVCYCAGLIGASQATSYAGLMAARIIHAFGSGVCEALPVQLVNDIFFLHERGQRIGYYTGEKTFTHTRDPGIPIVTFLLLTTGCGIVALCFGSTGPLFAGYMLNGGYSWNLFFYVEFAFGCALLIAAFFIVEETTYHRKLPIDLSDGADEAEKDKATTVESTASNLPPRKTFIQQLKFWGVYERDSDFFLMMARSFTYFLVPHVFWVIATYGKQPRPSGSRGRKVFFFPSSSPTTLPRRRRQLTVQAGLLD